MEVGSLLLKKATQLQKTEIETNRRFFSTLICDYLAKKIFLLEPLKNFSFFRTDLSHPSETTEKHSIF